MKFPPGAGRPLHRNLTFISKLTSALFHCRLLGVRDCNSKVQDLGRAHTHPRFFAARALIIAATLAWPLSLGAQSVSVTAPENGDRIVPGTPFVMSASATGSPFVGPTNSTNITGPVTNVQFYRVPNLGKSDARSLPPVSASNSATAISALGTNLNFISVVNGGSGYTTNPVVTISNLGGPVTNTTAFIGSGGAVTSVRVPTNGFPGFSNATITIGLPTATNGIQATAVAGYGITVRTNFGGSGYDTNFPPPVTIGPPDLAGGSQASAVAEISPSGVVTNISVTNLGSGYTAPPSVTIPTPGGIFLVGSDTTYPFSQTTALPGNDRYTLFAVSSFLGGGILVSSNSTNGPVVIGEQGTVPTIVLLTPQSATATAAISNGTVTNVSLVNNGTNYTTNPSVFLVGGGGTNAAATAVLSNNSVSGFTNITGGTNYTSAPTVLIEPPSLIPSKVREQVSISADTGFIGVPQQGDLVASVDFFVNGVLSNTVTTAPYNFSFTPETAGYAAIFARARTSRGITVDSGIVTYNVTEGTPPKVEITSPSGVLKVPQTPLTVSWNASDTDGSVISVQLLVNGVAFGAPSTTGTGAVVYTPSSAGSYVFVARATDNLGNVTDSAPVTVTIDNTASNPLPAVSLLPQTINDLAYVTGSQLYFNATAVARTNTTLLTNSNAVSFSVISAAGLVSVNAANSKIKDGANDVYSAAYEFTPVNIASSTLFAVARSTNNTNASITNVGTSAASVLSAAQAVQALPSVEVLQLPPSASTNPVAGGVVQLRAKASFPGTNTAGNRVEFYAGGALLGVATNNTNPATLSQFTHVFNWTTPTNTNSFQVSARAVGVNFTNTTGTFFGSSLSANSTTVNLSTNPPPTVSITMPATNGAVVGVGITNQITATATAATNASIREVQFYLDGIYQSSVTNFPYTFNFVPASAGFYKFAAVAIDSFGLQANSEVRTINATNGMPPSVTIDAPAALTTNLTVNQTLTVRATATAAAGRNIARVDFLANGLIVNTDASAPYQFTYTATNAGNFELIARATDDLGNQKDSVAKTLSVTQGTPPTVSILDPDNTTPITEVTPGIPVTVTVKAGDSDGWVTRVELLVGGQVVGSLTQAPYIFVDTGVGASNTFTPPSEGIYTIIARATDNTGNVKESDPVTIEAKSPVPDGQSPFVQVTQPIGAIFYVTGSSFFLNARATDADQPAVQPLDVQFMVNGLPVSNVSLGQIGNDYGVRYTPSGQLGPEVIRATAKDERGNESISQPNFIITDVAQNPLPTVEMLDILPGTPTDAGGTIKLRARAFFPRTANEQARVEFYANSIFVGTGTVDASDPSLYTFDWKTPTTNAAYLIEARAVALNWFTNEANNNVREFFASVISENAITLNTIVGNPPVVAITSPAPNSSVNVGQVTTITATGSVPLTRISAPPRANNQQVSRVMVVKGQNVSANDTLVEYDDGNSLIRTPVAGKVKAINVAVGSTMQTGQLIVELESDNTQGGTIQSVEFYVNGSLIGTDQSAPYSVNFTPPSTGIYYLSAVAESNAGLLGVSQPVAVSASLGKAPVVSLTTGSSASATASITSGGRVRSPLAITQSGSGYTIAPSVTFVGGGGSGAVGKADLKVTRIAVVKGGSGYTSAPVVTLSDPPSGGVKATATAIVNGGVVTQINITNPGRGYLSAPTVTLSGGSGKGASAKAYGGVNSVVVNPGGSKYKSAPTVVIAPPPAVVGGTETLIASAKDEDGSISKLEFLVNGVVQDTLELEPFVYQLPLTSAGTFSLQARATDNRGNVALSNQVMLLVEQGLPPVVSIVSPTNGAVLPAGQPIPISANASDPDGSIASVTFTVNGSQVGEPVTRAPYEGSFTPTSPGNYSIVAVALDSSGNRTQSAPAVVTVPATSIKVSVTSPLSKTPPESFTVGTSVFLSASASTTAGATITGVQFLVNGSPVGAAVTSAPYAASFVPTSTGTYTVRARATDTSGNSALSSSVTFEAKSPQPGVVPPTVVLSAPNESATFTAGSTIYLNYEAFLAQGNTLSEARLFVNGAPLVGVAKIGPTGRSFGAPLVFGADGTYTVYAQIRDSAGNTASSSPTVLTARAPQKTPPAVWIEPYQLTTPYLAVGQPVLLRAKANFGGNELPAVEFYANNVFIGAATEGSKNRDGTTSYTLNWVPEVAGSKITLTARATGSNFAFGLTQRVYASVVSKNGTVPAVTGLTIRAVPNQPNAGTPEAFVKDIYPLLLYRDAVYSEWKYYVDQLKAKRMSQADVVIALMGYNPKTGVFDAKSEYGTSVAMAFAPFARLGLSPNNASLEAFLSNLEGDFAPLPLSTYPGVGGAPYGATLGLGKAMQDLINSPAFTRKYPNVQAMTGPQFVSWLRTTMFPKHVLGNAAGLQSVSGGLMSNQRVTGFSQGSAAAFYSRFVLAAYTAPEKTFQLQLNSTALRYQLSGKWTASYGVKNPYSKAVVTKLLQEFPVGVQALSRVAVTSQVLTPVGTYTGTVDRASLNNSNGGAIQLTVNNQGAVTGAVTMNGQTSSFRANVSQDGKIEATATSTTTGSKVSYRLSLQVADPGTSKARITGSISSGTKKATLLARLNSWSNSNPAQDYSGSYSIQLQPSPVGSDLKSGVPSGNRFAEIQVSRDGSVQLVGQLATNVPFSWAGKLGADGSILLQANIKNQGSLMGNIALTKDKNRKISASGSLVWQKPKVGTRQGFKLTLRPLLR
jgi:hypothetical protein